MRFIQEEFNKSSGNFILLPGEYEGPLLIDRPCVIDGQHSTIWANRGPVVIVNSTHVTLKNLRIEVTGSPENANPAISLRINRRGTILENIEINGVAEGLEGETAGWSIPEVITLGDFAANKENRFSIEFEAPRSAEVVHNLKDVVITPQKIKPGRNLFNITVSNMRDNTILFGELLLKTSVIKRIYLTGKAKKGAPDYSSAPLILRAQNLSLPLQVNLPDEVIAPIVADDEQIIAVRKGQRIVLGQLQLGKIRVVYGHKTTSRPLTVDPYVFVLAKNGKVRSDNDLIFFGNEESQNKDIRVKTAKGYALATIELSKVDAGADRIIVCMSIYEDQSGANFSCIESPIIRVFSEEKELFRFSLDDLKLEKTVVAVEFYRYKGDWKVSFVGRGFKLGLDSLCREYGVDVE